MAARERERAGRLAGRQKRAKCEALPTSARHCTVLLCTALRPPFIKLPVSRMDRLRSAACSWRDNCREVMALRREKKSSPME